MPLPPKHLLKIVNSALFEGLDPHEIAILLDNPGVG